MRDYLERLGEIPGAQVNRAQGRATIPLPVADGALPGRLTTLFLGPGLVVHCIEIHSATIPDLSLGTGDQARSGSLLKINCCMRGRCELGLRSGGYTYLSAGEVALDRGVAEESFSYPSSDYQGLELLLDVDGLEGEEFAVLGRSVSAPRHLADACARQGGLQIFASDELVARIVHETCDHVARGAGRQMVAVKALELLMVLDERVAGGAETRRSYYTASQVDIAKETRRIIVQDLSVRHNARELAGRFGISETSLKSYFRGVYGRGYAEYQSEVRMREAARRLVTGAERVVEVGHDVGYASQAKFGAAFKSFWGVTPLEYRRAARLRRNDQEPSPGEPPLFS